MFEPDNERYVYCPRIGAHTQVNRTEGQCRDQHGCEKPDCPLRQEFGTDAYERRARLIGATLGVWPVRG